MSFQHIYNLALFWHFKMLNLAPKSQLDLASLKNLYPVCMEISGCYQQEKDVFDKMARSRNILKLNKLI